MVPDTNLSGLTLGRHQSQRVDAPQGVRVHCLHGTLWITQDGEARDIVLGPGDQYRLEHATTTYLSALDDVRYLLLRDPVAEAPRRMPFWRRAMTLRIARGLAYAV